MTDHVKRIVTTVEVSSGSRDTQYVTLMRVDRIARDAILREFSILRIPEPLKIWYKSLRSDPVSKTALKILHQSLAHARFLNIENAIKKITAETDQEKNQNLLDSAILKAAQKSINESLKKIRGEPPVIRMVAQCIKDFCIQYISKQKVREDKIEYPEKLQLLTECLIAGKKNKILIKEGEEDEAWFNKFGFNVIKFFSGSPIIGKTDLEKPSNQNFYYASLLVKYLDHVHYHKEVSNSLNRYKARIFEHFDISEPFQECHFEIEPLAGETHEKGRITCRVKLIKADKTVKTFYYKPRNNEFEASVLSLFAAINEERKKVNNEYLLPFFKTFALGKHACIVEEVYGVPPGKLFFLSPLAPPDKPIKSQDKIPIRAVSLGGVLLEMKRKPQFKLGGTTFLVDDVLAGKYHQSAYALESVCKIMGIMDLHPENIILTPDGQVVPIDLECVNLSKDEVKTLLDVDIPKAETTDIKSLKLWDRPPLSLSEKELDLIYAWKKAAVTMPSRLLTLGTQVFTRFVRMHSTFQKIHIIDVIKKLTWYMPEGHICLVKDPDILLNFFIEDIIHRDVSCFTQKDNAVYWGRKVIPEKCIARFIKE